MFSEVIRRSILTGVCALALLCTTVAAMAQDDTSMLDQVTLADGRQFTGRIIEETADFIKMEVVRLGMRTTQTWKRSEVLEVLRDAIPDPDAGKKEAEPEIKAAAGKVLYDPNDKRHTVYKVPVRGPIGLDAHTRIIRMIWNEAMEARANTIILEFDCEQPLGMADIEEYRDFFEVLKREARSKETKVVVWVKKARGVALAYALMFPDIYFQPDGEMGGGADINEQLRQSFSDEAVRAKMISAWVGICRGMAEEGGYDALLCEAMIRPEVVLSMRYEGDKPVFQADTNGEVVLDANNGPEPKNALELSAKQANEYGISGGTHRTIDDLMFGLGYREYRYVEGNAEDFATKWSDGWKAALNEYRYIRADMDLIGTYNWPIDRQIASRIAKLREVQRLMKKWPPLELFIDPLAIWAEIDTLQKELRNINNNEQRNRPGGGGGGAPGKTGGSLEDSDI